jgi:hypothetical protein
LTLTRSGFDKLLFVSGDQISEESIILAPNETRVWEGVYAPLTHSEVKDDVSVAASFNEYVSGNVLSDDENLTVVKLKCPFNYVGQGQYMLTYLFSMRI